MKLNKTIAQKIVKRTMAIIHRSVNVMDENGVIIASGDLSRLHQKHTGAVIALRQNRVVEIDDELARLWHFEARAGINLPIHYLGKNWGVVGISGEPSEVRAYAELVKMTAELIIEQHILLEKERWHRRYREEFILQWLKGKVQTDELQANARFFQLDLSLPRTVIIIQLLDSTAEQLQQWTTYLEQTLGEQETAVLGLDRIVLLKPIATMAQFDPKKLQPPATETYRYKIAVGASLAEQAVDFAYKTALATLDYGLTHFPKKSVYFFHQYKLPVLLNALSGSWQADELLKNVNPLYQQRQHAVLTKTLRYYFLSNCDLPHTAEKLFIHPNTLRYRLAKIEQLTGLSFNNIEDKFILYLSTVLGVK